MNRRRRRYIWLAAAVACAACATFTARRLDLSERLRFSHHKHVVSEENDCTDCHEGVAQSGEGRRGLFIGGEHGGCADCHEVKNQSKCKNCHLGSDRQLKLSAFHQERGLRFSHKTHGPDRVKHGCKACHPQAFSAKSPGVSMIPEMARCTESCHAHDMVQLRCEKCHADLQRHQLKPVTQLAHRGDFLAQHGKLASDTARCASCHDQTYCAECHAKTPELRASIRFPEQIQRAFIHRGDFVTRHATEARAQPMTCNKCHGVEHCRSCHQLAGLAPAPPTQQPQHSRKFHGAGVMDPTSPSFHGRLARRDITRCASCHDRGARSNCVDCHRVGALGGNPHPDGFRWSNKTGACRSTQMCQACHIGGTGCP